MQQSPLCSVISVGYLTLLSCCTIVIGEITKQPLSLVVPLGHNASFTCAIQGTGQTGWLVALRTTAYNISAGGNDTLPGGTNGTGGTASANDTIRELDTSTASDLAELEYDLGFLFHQMQNTTTIPSQNLTVHYLTATALGRNGSNRLNETSLRCYLAVADEGGSEAAGSGLPLVGDDSSNATVVVLSEVAQLILAGPPLSPIPIIITLSTKLLSVSWQKPFTWIEAADIIMYVVTIYDESGEAIVMKTDNATTDLTFEFERRDASLLCQELALSVTATNIVGESIPGRVLWEFPIDIGNMTDTKSEVAVVLLLDGRIQVSIGFNMPMLCPSQEELSYVVSVDKLGNSSGNEVDSRVALVGPVLANWSDTSGQLNITVVSSELVANQQYRVNISVDTAEAGSLSTTSQFGTYFNLSNVCPTLTVYKYTSSVSQIQCTPVPDAPRDPPSQPPIYEELSFQIGAGVGVFGILFGAICPLLAVCCACKFNRHKMPIESEARQSTVIANHDPWQFEDTTATAL